jgi:hypothetical protein
VLLLVALFIVDMRLAIVGLLVGSFALILMALSAANIKWRTKKAEKRFDGPQSEQVNNWLDALAKKDRKE